MKNSGRSRSLASGSPRSREAGAKLRAVVVFARAPELGETKTRLARYLGPRRTLQLYRAFLADTFRLARRVGARVFLAHTRGRRFREQQLADHCFEQMGATEGERFDDALKRTAQLSPPGAAVVIVGADTPHLPPEILEQAFQALRDVPAVVGPSPDGGFYLVGFSVPPVPLAPVFQNSGHLTEAVLRRLHAHGVTPRLLTPVFDVDRPDDLWRLADELRHRRWTGNGWIPPATTRCLFTLGGPMATVHSRPLDGALAPGRSLQRLSNGYR